MGGGIVRPLWQAQGAGLRTSVWSRYFTCIQSWIKRKQAFIRLEIQVFCRSGFQPASTYNYVFTCMLNFKCSTWNLSSEREEILLTRGELIVDWLIDGSINPLLAHIKVPLHVLSVISSCASLFYTSVVDEAGLSYWPFLSTPVL